MRHQCDIQRGEMQPSSIRNPTELQQAIKKLDSVATPQQTPERVRWFASISVDALERALAEYQEPDRHTNGPANGYTSNLHEGISFLEDAVQLAETHAPSEKQVLESALADIQQATASRAPVA